MVYRCRVLRDATKETYATFLPETQWERLKEHMLGIEKKGNIIEFQCFFGALAPSYPKAQQYLGMPYVMGNLTMQQAAAMNRVRNKLSATRTLWGIEDEGAQQAQAPAIEGGQALQNAEEGTHTSEHVEYIHTWKRETAT